MERFWVMRYFDGHDYQVEAVTEGAATRADVMEAARLKIVAGNPGVALAMNAEGTMWQAPEFLAGTVSLMDRDAAIRAGAVNGETSEQARFTSGGGAGSGENSPLVRAAERMAAMHQAPTHQGDPDSPLMAAVNRLASAGV